MWDSHSQMLSVTGGFVYDIWYGKNVHCIRSIYAFLVSLYLGHMYSLVTGAMLHNNILAEILAYCIMNSLQCIFCCLLFVEVVCKPCALCNYIV